MTFRALNKSKIFTGVASRAQLGSRACEELLQNRKERRKQIDCGLDSGKETIAEFMFATQDPFPPPRSPDRYNFSNVLTKAAK